MRDLIDFDALRHDAPKQQRYIKAVAIIPYSYGEGQHGFIRQEYFGVSEAEIIEDMKQRAAGIGLETAPIILDQSENT